VIRNVVVGVWQPWVIVFKNRVEELNLIGKMPFVSSKRTIVQFIPGIISAIYPPNFSLYVVPFFSPSFTKTFSSIRLSKSLNAVLSEVSFISWYSLLLIFPFSFTNITAFTWRSLSPSFVNCSGVRFFLKG
jgi:hypothetical protein